jgi:hypothetical protein
MYLVEKPKKVQVHFTLDLDGSRTEEIEMDEKYTQQPRWQQVDDVSCVYH